MSTITLVTIIAGDAMGGPHAKVEMELYRAPDDITDAEVIEWLDNIKRLFTLGHGKEPESVIVTVDEVDEGVRDSVYAASQPIDDPCDL